MVANANNRATATRGAYISNIANFVTAYFSSAYPDEDIQGIRRSITRLVDLARRDPYLKMGKFLNVYVYAQKMLRKINRAEHRRTHKVYYKYYIGTALIATIECPNMSPNINYTVRYQDANPCGRMCIVQTLADAKQEVYNIVGPSLKPHIWHKKEVIKCTQT